jgi:hypothetical protein
MWAQQEQRSPARIVSRAGSLKRPGSLREVGQVFLQGRVKGLAKSLQRGKVDML